MKRLSTAAGIVAATLTILGILKKSGSVYKSILSEQNPFEGKRVKFVADDNDPINADGVRGHLEEIEVQEQHKATFYEHYMKRAIDVIFSFAGLVILSPIFLIISVAVWIDDPGPVLFIQKRVGKNKKFFRLHKFRSMRNDTPHDVPTHKLKNPESHITNVGRVLRKTSLDELPQIWDIWIGNMSIIGPRPALWNQDLLIAERDRYNANDIRPGLTGLAQISGRDELEIPDKAQIDGEYVRKIGFWMDLKCFFGTILSVLKHDGVVEGGTGSMK